ncbi:MAG: type VI secretion system protein TssA [Polaromonas sp.]
MTTYSLPDLGKQPIEGPLAVGNEVRDEPIFEQLEGEVGKLSSPVHSSTVDWARIAGLSGELLATKGKDLMVACYLAGGLLETRGLPGLSDGLRVIADMLETYWDTLYPSLKRMRGRRNAVVWLVERTQQRAQETGWDALPPQEAALVSSMQASLKMIDAVLTEKDSDAPSIRPLLSLVNNLSVIEPEPEPVPVPEPDPAQSAPQASPRTPASPPSLAAPVFSGTAAAVLVDSEDSASHALKTVCDGLKPIASWLLDAGLSNPLPYRLARLAAWTFIDSLPSASAGQTRIPGPISQITDVLTRLTASQANEDIVRFAEAQLAIFPFWLDLNYVCASALERMGSGFDAARLEVCGESARLAARLPGLEKLSFAGGMPFATGDTAAWLGSLSAGLGGSGGGGGQSRESGAVVTAVGNARALAANEDLAGAVACLQDQVALAKAPRDQLFLRIRLCELLLAKRPGAALQAFALAIVDTIDRYELAAWDPALALDGLQVAYGVMARNEEGRAAADTLLKRIVPLDAAAAAALVT